MQTAEHHREQFELAYATAWAKDREGGETPEQLAAEIKSWRAGDTYEEEFIRLRFGWEGYQWARASQCLAQIEEPAQPVCWIRFCSDGSTEGPIMHSQICEARKTSGAWTPLYAGAAPALEAPAAPVHQPLTNEQIEAAFKEGRAIFDRLCIARTDIGLRLECGRAVERAVLAAAPQAPAAPLGLPNGWVPCILTHDGQNPEEVAYGPQIMMDRLKKWLGRYFELLAQKVLAEPVHAEMLAALQAVAMDVVHVGAGENTISDAARAKVEAVLEKIGAPWPGPAAAPAAGNWIAAEEVDRLVRDLDVALHGEADAAPQASLCDIVGLAKAAAGKLGRPVLAAPAAPAVDARNAARLDWLQRNAEVRFSLDYEQVEISFPAPEWLIGVDSIDEAIDAAIADQAAAQAKEGGAA